MTRLRQGFGGQVRFFLCVIVFAPVLSACGDITGQVQDTVSGALAPVTDAVNEVARRANEVGEGINDVTGRIQRVRGALSGSGTSF